MKPSCFSAFAAHSATDDPKTDTPDDADEPVSTGDSTLDSIVNPKPGTGNG